jgi:hypothetical protein
MTAPRFRALPRLLAAALVATLLTLLLPGLVPSLAPSAQAAARATPTKARLVKVIKTVAFPKGATPGAVETESLSREDGKICGYYLPSKLSVSRTTEDDELSLSYLPTASTSKAKGFVTKVGKKRSCEDGLLRRTTLKGAPKGTAAKVLVIPVDETHDVRFYLAFASTGRAIVVAGATSKKDLATLLTNAVRSYRKAKLA